MIDDIIIGAVIYFVVWAGFTRLLREYCINIDDGTAIVMGIIWPITLPIFILIYLFRLIAGFE